MKPTLALRSFLFGSTLLASASSAYAVSATWNGTTDALWATTTNWSASPVPGTGDIATFNNAGGAVDTISLGAGVTISSILFDTFSAAAYTVGSGAVGSQSLNINNSGGVTVNSTVTTSQLFNANLTLGTAIAGSYTFTNNSVTSGQTLTFAGNVSGGTGGTAAAKTLTVTGAGNTTISGVVDNGGGGALAFSKSGAGTVILSGVNTYTGATAVNEGSLTLSGARTANMGNISVGSNGISSAILNITNASAAFTANNSYIVGSSNTAGNTGTVNQSAGTVTINGGNQLLIGNGGTGLSGAQRVNGVYNLSGGTLTSSAATAIRLGVNTFTSGTLNVSGGTLTLTGGTNAATSPLQIGRADSAASDTTNAYNQTGGTATVSRLTIGGHASGARVTAGFSVTGGSFTATNFDSLAVGGTGVSTMTIGGTGLVTLPNLPTVRGLGSTATLIFDGGTLRNSATGTFITGLTNAFIQDGGAQFDTALNSTTISQNLLADPVSLGGGLTKIGGNTLTLTGANTYTGGTTISGGIVNVTTNNTALGSGAVTVGTGAIRLVVATGLSVANNITLGSATGLTGRGLIEAGTTAGTATVSGPINITATPTFGGHFAAPTANTILSVTGAITSSVQVTHRTGIAVYSGGGTGYTAFGVGEGTARIGANNGLATTATVAIGTAAAGILDLNGFNQTLVGVTKGGSAATIGNSSTTADSTLTLTGTSSYGGTIVDVISPGTRKVALTVNGGSLTLSGTNTYTGATTITAGTLALSGAGSIANSPTIIVGASTTFDVSGVTGGYSLGAAQTLTGTGTVAGSMTVAGTLSPGNSPGIMATGSQTWVNGGDYNFQMLDATGAAGAGFDQIQVTGTLDLSSLTAGGFNINLWSLSSVAPDVSGDANNFNNSLTQSWIILTTSGGITSFDATDFAVNVTANNGTGGFTNALGGGTFSLSADPNNLVLNFTAVPEPNVAALIGALGGILLLRRRR